MALKRAQHWATRAYHQFLLARRHTPFAWGSNDCALFAADGIQAITGTDIAADFRGKYSDEAGAMAAIKSIANGSTIADAAAWCAGKHGLTECIHPLMAQRGDLVIVQAAQGLMSGLVDLNGRHVLIPGQRGVVRLSISLITRSWHV